MSPSLSPSFLSEVERLPSRELKIRWFMIVIVALSSMNYPDVIPQIWKHCSSCLLSAMQPSDQLVVARKIREALTKSCGIVGAAKTGTSMRLLAQHTPPHLLDTVGFRFSDDRKKAAMRGKAFHSRIYGSNKEFDPSATGKACPDYVYVVRNILYARIFSFDVILDDLDTGYIIVAALIGNDTPIQCRHHMKGMLYNGASHDDLVWLRDVCLRLAKELGADKGWRSGGKIEIPSI